MEFASLLEEAKAAPPDRRIEWRDRIVAYGARGIEGVQPWLSSPTLAAFAIRVIERAGANGEAVLATRILRSARKGVPEVVAGDVDWALQRLRLAERAGKTSAPTPALVRPAVPLRRERPHLTRVVRRRAS